MSYASLRACLNDLELHNQLVQIEQEIDPNLEAAEIQRRVYRAGGPAILFARSRGCRFPLVSNLFGTLDRAKFIFRDSLEMVRRLIELKIDPSHALRHPLQGLGAVRAAGYTLPKFVSSGPVLTNQTSVDQLPALKSWPADGGPFITLPQVYTEDPDRPGWRNSNLGMYRVQLSGNQYEANRQVGLHYQIHRGIGVHHAAAVRRGERLPVNVHVGGPPAMNIAAVMPLPEGLSELIFAGVLGRRRVRMVRQDERLPVLAEADFCLSGYIEPDTLLPEGPFGDHLGYYSLVHDFPVMRIEPRLSSRRRDLAIHGRRQTAARRHDVRPVDSRVDRADHPQRDARRARRTRGRRSGRSSTAVGDRQRTLYAVCSPAAAARDTHASQRDPRARANVFGQILDDRR